MLEYLIDEKGREIDNYKSNTNNPLNLHINYSIVSILKVQVTPKSESKLYNYNIILKCSTIKF